MTDRFEDVELARLILHKAFPLIDLSVIPDDVLRGHGALSAFEIIEKHIKTRDMLNYSSDIEIFVCHDWVTSDEIKALVAYLLDQGISANPENC